METFDHTADVGLRVTGVDLNDLFRTAAEGVFDYIVVNRNAVRVETRSTLELRGDGAADLLVTWLNELIFRFETTHVLLNWFEVQVAKDGTGLRAEIGGEKIDRTRHELDHEVKAVTRHGVVVESGGDAGGWVAEMILDI